MNLLRSSSKKKGIETINQDQEYKNVSFEKLPHLKAVFTKNGTVTAANASTINDGASALVLVSKSYIKKNNLNSIAKVVAYADAATNPEWFTISPVKGTEIVLSKVNLTIKDIDFVEVNEAFSVVPLV